MAMRQVVSYDDITLPTAAASGQPIATPGPPPKKRKVNNTPRNSNARSAQYTQHWDEPDSSAPQINYDEGVGDVAMGAQEEVEEGEEEEEESRNLTHEEIWDDSALVNAWDSAMAEYEGYHGKGGKWKEQPVKKSPLWYVVPPEASDKKSKGKDKATTGTVDWNGSPHADETTPTPHNLDTSVPRQDPSFRMAQVPAGFDHTTYALPEPGAMVSQDEAFSRALSAMYWGGYWTAVYHYHRAGEQTANAGEDTVEGEGEEEMLPAQR